MSRDHKTTLTAPSRLTKSGRLSRRRLLQAAGTTAAFLTTPSLLAQAIRPQFKRVPTQYIAALGANEAHSGNNAEQWGLWRKDPGPRGVRLRDFEKLQARGGIAPAQWTFDSEDWWLEENGLIMEQPEFPLPAGHYLVTGGREVTAILTVQPPASGGSQHWQLDSKASIYDVTHLRCRSGRYTSAKGAGACTPAQAKQADFPVRPGAAMPAVADCDKQDYAVLIVTAIADL